MIEKMLCLFLVVFILPHFISAADPVVQITNGKFKGREVKTREGKTYYHFKGIPFAKPPLGKLRFMPPEEPDNWEGILDPNKEVMCFQGQAAASDKETEDCLLINLYTPYLPNGSNNLSLPVIIWWFGGGFYKGSNGEYDGYGPEFIIPHDVILVVPNYRIGPFGFLSMQNDVIPGNYGLKDQHMAIKWVNKNIAAFGGDPKKLTIMGQSAGGIGVAYQLLYPPNKGLFRAGLMMSGTCFKPSVYQRRSLEFAKKAINYLDPNFLKNNTTPKEILAFLQKQDAKKIKKMSYSIFSEDANTMQTLKGFLWAPVVEPEHETAFVTQNMYDMVKSGNYIKVPLIMGIASEEMLPHSQSSLDSRTTKYFAKWDSHPEYLVPTGMHIPDDQKADVGKKIKKIYIANNTWAASPQHATSYWSDLAYSVSQIQHAEIARNYGDVWFYQFSYDGDLGGNPFRFASAPTKPLVAHAEDRNYIFGNKDSDLSKFPKADRTTSQRLTTMWTNFAKYLDPTPEATDLLIKWPKVSKDVTPIKYLNIFDDLTVEQGPKETVYRQWTKLRSDLAKGSDPTWP